VVYTKHHGVVLLTESRNLDGYKRAATLDNHFAQFAASRWIATDGILIPNGTIASTKGTPLDFSKATSLGAAINRTVGLNLCGTSQYLPFELFQSFDHDSL